MRPTAHQAAEYLVALLLVYGAMHASGSPALAAVGVAAASAGLATISRGRLAVRPLLGPKLHRAGDAIVAIAAVVAAVAVRDTLAAVIPLAIAAIVLVRLTFTVPYEPEPRPPSPPIADRVQPQLNQAARAAGIFVRNRRQRR